MAERFRSGGTLFAFGRGPYATDAAHVSVEFVHPVIVGKRALPALDLSAAPGATSMCSPAPTTLRIAFGPPAGDPELAPALAAARRKGALTLALPGAEADYGFAAPSRRRARPPGGLRDPRPHVVRERARIPRARCDGSRRRRVEFPVPLSRRRATGHRGRRRRRGALDRREGTRRDRAARTGRGHARPALSRGPRGRSRERLRARRAHLRIRQRRIGDRRDRLRPRLRRGGCRLPPIPRDLARERTRDDLGDRQRRRRRVGLRASDHRSLPGRGRRVRIVDERRLQERRRAPWARRARAGC